jgi:hypothetical protein
MTLFKGSGGHLEVVLVLEKNGTGRRMLDHDHTAILVP